MKQFRNTPGGKATKEVTNQGRARVIDAGLCPQMDALEQKPDGIIHQPDHSCTREPMRANAMLYNIRASAWRPKPNRNTTRAFIKELGK
jgi:hypothetical protein